MKVKGFTLIELMIAIAIIGILASIAIPAYQNYLIRARVMEGVQLAQTAKLAVSEATITNNELPVNQAATGYESPRANATVASIVIAGDGTGDITVTYTPRAGGGTMVLHPKLQANGDIIWTCNEGTLPAKYRPANCRSK